MKVMIVYDSVHGNTEKIARTIGNALVPQNDVAVTRASDVKPEQLAGLQLLIVGSPTHGGRATQAIQDFFKSISESGIRGLKVATFDTRVPAKFARIFGHAAGRIADHLKKMGCERAASPEGFFVKGTKGPLVEGELERAADWAKEIFKNIK